MSAENSSDLTPTFWVKLTFAAELGVVRAVLSELGTRPEAPRPKFRMELLELAGVFDPLRSSTRWPAGASLTLLADPRGHDLPQAMIASAREIGRYVCSRLRLDGATLYSLVPPVREYGEWLAAPEARG